jgi:hypothetical protein
MGSEHREPEPGEYMMLEDTENGIVEICERTEDGHIVRVVLSPEMARVWAVRLWDSYKKMGDVDD